MAAGIYTSLVPQIQFQLAVNNCLFLIFQLVKLSNVSTIDGNNNSNNRWRQLNAHAIFASTCFAFTS